MRIIRTVKTGDIMGDIIGNREHRISRTARDITVLDRVDIITVRGIMGLT